MERQPWHQRDDVNGVAFIILILIIIFGLTAVPPEWIEASR